MKGIRRETKEQRGEPTISCSKAFHTSEKYFTDPVMTINPPSCGPLGKILSRPWMASMSV